MNLKYRHLRDEYLELAYRRPRVNRSRPAVYTASMIFKLRDMACKGVYPDNRFSDEECNIWSAFHLLVKEES